jgi:hypothetical protein
MALAAVSNVFFANFKSMSPSSSSQAVRRAGVSESSIVADKTPSAHNGRVHHNEMFRADH